MAHAVRTAVCALLIKRHMGNACLRGSVHAHYLFLVHTLILSNHCLQCTMKNMAKPLVVICRDKDFEGQQIEEEMKMFVRARIREFLS